MNTFFAPHGEFKINVSNNILIARLTGSWNLECAESFSQAFKTHIQSLKHEKWGHLVFLDDWELSAPEIFPIVTDLVSFCIANGLEKSAQVYGESMMKKFFVDKMVTEKHGNFERQIFNKQDKAIKWLSEYGFTINDGGVAEDLV
jgi:hypothetical protein